jgi:hypothetical protein
VILLTAPFDPARTGGSGWPWTPSLEVAAVTLALVATGFAVELHGGALGPVGRAMAGAGVHAGFLGLGWAIAGEGRPGWQGPAFRLAAILMVASVSSRVSPWGALVYLVTPLALLGEAGRWPESRMVGLGRPRLRACALGLGAGVFLGVHLLIAASLTFGYAVRIRSASDYLSTVAYDVGASALTAEWLFRGALFSLWWRRWAFWPAASLSTACALVRYLLDPNLPQAPEARLGAAFYVGLLGLSACALRAWSGSLLPGYLATVGFFVAYRLLGQ